MSSISSINKDPFLVAKKKIITKFTLQGDLFDKKNLITLFQYLFHPQKPFPASVGFSEDIIQHCYNNFYQRDNKVSPIERWQVSDMFTSGNPYEPDILKYVIEMIEKHYTPHYFNEDRVREVLSKFT